MNRKSLLKKRHKIKGAYSILEKGNFYAKLKPSHCSITTEANPHIHMRIISIWQGAIIRIYRGRITEQELKLKLKHCLINM